MVEVLEFVFASFLRWLGTFMLLLVVFGSLANWRPVTIVRTCRHKGEEG